VFGPAPRGPIVEKLVPAELLDELPKGMFGQRLTESLFNAPANNIQWCSSVELLRDEVLDFAKAEEPPTGRILDNNSCAVSGRLLPNNEIAA
jgi:hypothetical protein